MKKLFDEDGEIGLMPGFLPFDENIEEGSGLSRRNVSKYDEVATPIAPRNLKKSFKTAAVSGFSGFISLHEKENNDESASDEQGVQRVVSQNQRQTEASNYFSKNEDDGSSTRRASKSCLVGGFTARLEQLNIKSCSFINKGCESESTDEKEEEEASPHFDLTLRKPVKLVPDKSIMKKSRFGPPIINCLPEAHSMSIENFWKEQDDRTLLIKKWDMDIKSASEDKIDLAKDSRHVHFQLLSKGESISTIDSSTSSI